MAFQEFFNRKAEKVAFRQNMEKFGQIRDKFLEMLVEKGEESTHSFGEVISGDAKGRRITMIKLVAAGDWAQGNNIQVEIFATASKNKLQQANKKPTVHVMLTFDDRVVRSSIPKNVINTSTYTTEGKFGNRDAKDVTFSYESMAEVIEYYRAGKLAVTRE